MKKTEKVQLKQNGGQKKPHTRPVTTKPYGEKRNRAEEALRASEARYRATLYSIGDCVITTDTEGRVGQMNPAAEKITGWREAEAKGKPIGDAFRIVNEDTRREVENPVGRVLQEGLVVGLSNHTLLIARDGSEYPIADSGAPIRNPQGEITGVVLVFRDQAAERATEKALRESERKFRETVTYLDEGHYSCTLDGVLLDHNRAFNRMLGFEVSQDLRGTKLPDFWQNPEDRKGYVSELKDGGVVSNYLINAKTIGGEKIVVMANSHLVKDEKGKPVGIEGTFANITDSKRMEDALNESEAKYRTLFENAQVGIYRTKLDGSAFLDVNDKFAEIIGVSRQELLGSPGRIRWANPENRDKMLKRLREQGGILTNYEAQVISKNGKVKDVLASIELYPGEGYIEGTMSDITERKQAEKILLESEARFSAVFHNNAIGISITRLVDGQYIDVNEAFLNLFGYTREEALSHTSLQLQTWAFPEDRDRVVKMLHKQGQALNIEAKFCRKSGEIWTGQFSANVIKIAGEQHILVHLQDITERKRMEEALASSEQFLRNVIEQSPVSLWISDSEGTMIKMNQACRDLFGVTDEEAVGKYNLLKDNLIEAQGFMALVGDVFEKGEIARFTIDYDVPRVEHIEAKEGTHRILDVVISPIKDMHGKLTNVLVEHKDITERKRAEDEILRLNAELEQRVADRTAQLQTANRQLESELAERKSAQEALRESDERFRSLSEAAFEAINIHDGGVLLDANEQYYAMFGYKPEELLGKQVMALTIASEAIETVKKEIATGGVGPYESTGQRKDGTRFPMEIRVRELEYKGRKVRMAAIMDISERKQAEQALQQNAAQLEAANKELEAFSYSISHDLRAPLRAMDGFSRILLEEYASQLPTEAQRYLNLVHNNAQQMGHLIEDLLAFSRLSRLPLHKQTVAMAEVVQKALAELRAEQEGRNVEVTIGDLPVCEADPALLKQVWVNLLSNALKFTRERKAARIEIGWTQPVSGEKPVEGCYFVKDNGVGFDMQYVDKLFGVFQQLHRSEEYEGTGVGLAIVQRIVHRHGGGVWAEAEVDKGAAFYFTLGGGT